MGSQAEAWEPEAHHREAGGQPPRSGGGGEGAELRGEVADLLFVLAAGGGPVVGGAAVLVLLFVECQLALDEGCGLTLDLGRSGSMPLAEAALELCQLLVLPGEPLAQLKQLLAAADEVLFFELVLLGQFQAELGE